MLETGHFSAGWGGSPGGGSPRPHMCASPAIAVTTGQLSHTTIDDNEATRLFG
jgi:hypothetical protein